MTAIRPERLGADRTVPEKTGPEVYAPNRKSSERTESEQAAVTAFEGEIREFVRRDVAHLRRQRNDVEQPASEPVTDNLNVLIRRVSGASMDEIDRVILELQGVREMLRSRGRTRQPGNCRLCQPQPRGHDRDEGDRRQPDTMEERAEQLQQTRRIARDEIAIAGNSGDGCFDPRMP